MRILRPVLRNFLPGLCARGLAVGLALVPGMARAQAGRAALAWPAAPAARAALNTSPWAGRLVASRLVAPDVAVLRATLAAAPMEGAPATPLILTLPHPDGSLVRFQVVEAPVMAPALAAQFPQIKTYAGIGLDDPTATLRADITPEGFHAQVLSRREGGTFYIDPIQNTDMSRGLVVYDRRDLRRTGSGFTCQFGAPGTGTGSTPAPVINSPTLPNSTAQRVTTSLGGTLRTYRLAVAATGEYTAFHGGTVALGQAAIVTTVNRVTGVYEKELAVRMVLVANNSSLVYTNAATDPYANTSNDLAANQSNITTVIGSANYDIGHLVGTGGGGVAGLGVVCNTSNKARGLTGSGSPVNDAFDIDYVAHEMGHQFSGNHPFNGSTGSCTGGNRNASTAWEPGSGSTIQAYAGICSPQDLQPNSDAYFHGGSISEMTTFINSTSCPTSAASGNTPPTVGTPANKSIPASTPFRLTATASDTDGDVLSYCWEEMDLGAQGAPVTTTTQTAGATVPLFRSWSPVASSTRFFPRLNELRNNTVAYGEFLPSVARTMAFRCTVRDQRFSTALGRIVGGVNQSNTVTLTVVNTGAAFAVTAPNTAVTLSGTTSVTWNVAGTTANDINCANVDILLSTDGGLTFPTTLATAVPNSGTASVTLPNTPSTTARIMVVGSDNYFFDISNANFTIVNANPNAPTIASFTPAQGTAGTVVAITGTNFTGATAVSFNGTAASSFTVNSATQITATVAAGTTSGAVAVTTANGTANSSGSFTVLTAPVVTSFSPTSGTPGTAVTITGSGFTGATAVNFNGTSAAFTVASSTSITTTVPAGATTGTISVTNSLGTGTSATSFTVIAAPANDLCTAPNLPLLTCGSTVTGTTTNSTSTGDPTATCSAVTIYPASGGVFYQFIGTGGSVTLSTCNAATNFDTELFVYTGSCGSLTCVTANDDQTGTCAANATTTPSSVTFTSVANTTYLVFVSGFNGAKGNFALTTTCTAPTLTSFSPASGLAGASVSLTGTLFATASAVRFNGTTAPSFTVNSATSITATVPAGATTGAISVVTGAGTANSATNFTVLQAPVINAQSFNLAENSANSTAVGTVAASDPDAGQTLTYAITAGNGTGAFAINAATGALTVANSAVLDFESTTSFALTVQVTDNGSPTTSSSATVTVNITNVNEAPSVSGATFSLNENSANATAVGTVSASDPDAGATLTYSITAGNTGGAFSFSGNQLMVASAAALDFEANPTFALTVQVSDGALTASTTVTVNLNDVNEAPAIFAQSFNVAENSANATAVSTVVASDPDASATLTYSITAGNTGGAFSFSGNQLMVANAAALDFETNPTFALTVQVSDGALTASNTVTVNLTNVSELPTVASFSPASGAVGTTVTITGTNFLSAGTVTVAFNGTAATTTTVGSGTSLTAVVPTGATTGLISVTNADGTGSSASSFVVGVLAAPTITSFTPTTGLLGTVVTITGTNFTGATAVKFNGVSASSFTVNSATSISTSVPSGATTGKLSVTTGGGTALSVASFTVQVPVVSMVSPSAAVTGTVVTITGSSFTGATGVAFNGVPAISFTVGSATSITATVPANAITGNVSVTTPTGTGTSVAIFKVLPTLTAFSPASGGPGQLVTLTGSGFSGVTSVKFNTTVTTSFTIVDPTTITVAVPAAATTGKIAVVNAGGSASSVASFTVLPSISGFVPAQGAPGSIVLVQGLNFVSGTVVRFNGVTATTTYNSTTQLTAVVPAAATTGLVSATSAAGTGTSATAYTVVSGAIPTISSFTPTTNVYAGVAVTITGTNFTGATLVRFNNVNATTFTVNSATSITATVPAGALTGKVYVATPTGMAQSALSLTIIQPPTLTSFAPTSGAVGSVVLLAGTNLTGATSVTLNGVAVPYTVNSALQIAATLPAGATTGKFAVTTIAGTATTVASFTVTAGPAPTITAISPGTGLRGSTVVVTGTNFTGVTSVKVNTIAVMAASYTVNSATQITLTVPSTATTGRIYVTTSGGGMAQSAVYTVILAPTISSFTPATGVAGTLVTINGTNYTSVSSVKFGGVEATSFTVVSTARITATVPSGAVTGTITVTNPAGTATSAGTFTYTGPRPAIAATRILEPVRIELYPNPASEKVVLNVSGGNTAEVAPVAELLDATGRLVTRLTLTDGTGTLPVTNLPKGVYSVRVSGQVQRLVVE